MEFDIPDGLLKAGFNAVRLTAEQRHRVDCSPEATYELWTQIDPSQTGLVMPEAASGITHLSDLAALWPNAEGALPIRAVLAAKTRPANVERIIRAAQVIALAGRFEQPLIDVGPLADGAAGVNLVVGTVADIAGIRGLDAMGPVTGPKVIVLPAASGRRVTVVATGTSDAEVDQAVSQLAETVRAEPKGAPEGLRAAAAFPGYRVEGGERVRLRNLGLVSQEFSGHFFRIGFNVIMPPDFLPADYAKVMLDLAGGYAPGLAKDAQVVVYINGRSVASARLPKSAGDVFRQNQIPLPLSYWRPGLNRVEIGAKVPVPSDAVCDPIATIVGKKRFLFLDSTELVLPPLARIARMPNLSVTASGGLPYTAGRGRSKLFVPLPDKDTVAAAATLATRMAVSAGRPIDFEFTTARPAEGSGPTLVVAPARMLDPAMMASAGLDPEVVRAAWQDRAEASLEKPSNSAFSRAEIAVRNRLLLQRDVPPLCRLPRWSARAAPAARASAAVEPVRSPAQDAPDKQDLFDEWSDTVRGRGRWLAGAGHWLAATRDWAGDTAAASWSWASERLNTSAAPSIITPRASLIIAQSIQGDAPDNVVTIVTAPNAETLGASVACLADPRVWTRADGRLSVLDASDGALDSVAADATRYIPTGPLSVENIRLITAGWLSMNPGLYVLLALLMAVCLSATTTHLVRNVGRRQE